MQKIYTLKQLLVTQIAANLTSLAYDFLLNFRLERSNQNAGQTPILEIVPLLQAWMS